MKDLELIKKLVGQDVMEKDLQFTDYYVNDKLGIFIPSLGRCGYASRENHSHPSYMIVVFFDEYSEVYNHYRAEIVSPGVLHNDYSEDYYCIFIDKDYFESVYLTYSDNIPVFDIRKFYICSDVLKALNMFAFEYSKQMKNSSVTLTAQAVILTNWIIRSILGDDMDMRSISDNYEIARIQHYIEQHYEEKLSVSELSRISHMSPSGLGRAFQREFNTTVMKYILKIRLEKAKLLLRRENIAITDISHRCGLGSSAYFTQIFKKELGVTPTEYRKSYQR